jgi:hypothetical protein
LRETLPMLNSLPAVSRSGHLVRGHCCRGRCRRGPQGS